MDGAGQPETPRFSVVRRGYDRAQVDEVVAALLGSPGRSLDEVLGERAAPRPPVEFDVVLRGYAPQEVEAFFARFARDGEHGEWADEAGRPETPRFSAVWRGYRRVQVDEAVTAVLSSPGRSLDEVFPDDGPPVEFDVVLRGYAPQEVDAFIARFGR